MDSEYWLSSSRSDEWDQTHRVSTSSYRIDTIVARLVRAMSTCPISMKCPEDRFELLRLRPMLIPARFTSMLDLISFRILWAVVCSCLKEQVLAQRSHINSSDHLLSCLLAQYNTLILPSFRLRLCVVPRNIGSNEFFFRCSQYVDYGCKRYRDISVWLG